MLKVALKWLILSARFVVAWARFKWWWVGMTQQEQQYLHEMGIQSYEIAHPERLLGYSTPKWVLPESCQLLLVSPKLPQGATAVMFERVLKSINLSLEQALHIYPEQLGLLSQHSIEWVWFAGCDKNKEVTAKTLTSPLLEEIDGNTQHRRSLWQQICTYQ